MKNVISNLTHNQTYEFWVSVKDAFGNESIADMPSTGEITFLREIFSDQNNSLFQLIETTPGSGTYYGTLEGGLIFGSGGRIFLDDQTLSFTDNAGTEIIGRGMRVWESSSIYAKMAYEGGAAVIEVVGGSITSGYISTDMVGSTTQRIVIDALDNTLRFYNDSNINIITIDDSIYSTVPGMKIVDGLLMLTESSTNGLNYIYGDHIDIYGENTKVLDVQGVVIDDIDIDLGYFYLQDTSSNTYAKDRTALWAQSSISNASNTSNAIGLEASAFNNGVGSATAIIGKSDDIAMRLGTVTDFANDYVDFSVDVNGDLTIDAVGNDVKFPTGHTLSIGTETITEAKIQSWDAGAGSGDSINAGSSSFTISESLGDATLTFATGAEQVTWFLDDATGDLTLTATSETVNIVSTALQHNGTSVSLNTHNHSGVYEPVDSTILRQSDVDDTPVNGVIIAPISSNWAYDHINDTVPPHDKIGDALSHYASANLSVTDTVFEIANDSVVNHDLTITVSSGGNSTITSSGGTINFTSTNLQHSGSEILDTSDVDDTPVNAATTAPVSSNWAYDHINTNHHDRIIDGSTYTATLNNNAGTLEFDINNAAEGTFSIDVGQSANTVISTTGSTINFTSTNLQHGGTAVSLSGHTHNNSFKTNLPFIFAGTVANGTSPPVLSPDTLEIVAVKCNTGAGTCTVDVQVGGTSVLTGTISVDSDAAWETGIIKTDGTEDLTADEEITVVITSVSSCDDLSVNIICENTKSVS